MQTTYHKERRNFVHELSTRYTSDKHFVSLAVNVWKLVISV